MPRIPTCHPHNKYGGKGLCMPCYLKKYYQAHRTEARINNNRYRATPQSKVKQKQYWDSIGRFSRQGITKNFYEAMSLEQAGRCAICKRARKLVIDHDHACCPTKGRSCGKCIRGLLCDGCNTKLGWMENHLKEIGEHLGWVN